MTGAGSFAGVKRSGRDVDHPSQSSAEFKERVELYLFYSRSLVKFTFTYPSRWQPEMGTRDELCAVQKRIIFASFPNV